MYWNSVRFYEVGDSIARFIIIYRLAVNDNVYTWKRQDIVKQVVNIYK